jgi:hypothetical protein
VIFICPEGEEKLASMIGNKIGQFPNAQFGYATLALNGEMIWMSKFDKPWE